MIHLQCTPLTCGFALEFATPWGVICTCKRGGRLAIL